MKQLNAKQRHAKRKTDTMGKKIAELTAAIFRQEETASIAYYLDPDFDYTASDAIIEDLEQQLDSLEEQVK